MFNINIKYLDGTKENFVGANSYSITGDGAAIEVYYTRKKYIVPLCNTKRICVEEVD